MRAIAKGCAVEIARPIHDESALRPTPEASGKAVKQGIRPTATGRRQLKNRTATTYAATIGGHQLENGAVATRAADLCGAIKVAHVVENHARKGVLAVARKTVSRA